MDVSKKPVINETIKINDSNLKSESDKNDFIDVLSAIEEEMAAVRELYVNGYITKGIYISETDRLYEKAKVLRTSLIRAFMKGLARVASCTNRFSGRLVKCVAEKKRRTNNGQ